MTQSASIFLNEDQAEFVNRQVETGVYDSAAAVVTAGLKMLEERAAKVKALEEALIKGEKGPFTPFDPDALLAQIHAMYLP